jgi:hypothetical protein
MSLIATTAARAPGDPLDPLVLQRDDGPIARALGRAAGRVSGMRALVLMAAAAVPLLGLAAFGGDGVPHAAAAAAIAWLVALGGLAGGGRPDARLGWTMLPALRLCEYAGLLWLAALAGSSSLPAAFALVAAVAFRHYELMYRLRLRGTAPAPWLNALSGGWDGRLIAGWLLLAAGALPAGFYVLAALLGALFVSESVASWLTYDRSGQAPVDADDEEAEE